jgi:uncharacterized membrane protein YdbT with pleckstrin-like domain
MRLVPGTDTVPNAVNKYLLPQEHQVITVRYHPAALIVPGTLAVGGFIAATALTFILNLSTDALTILWPIWGLLLLYGIVSIFGWTVNYFVVTSRRMLVITGIVSRDVEMIPLARAEDLRFRRTAMGRLLGYGRFIIEPHGQDQALRSVNFLPYPEQLFLEVCGLMFPGRGDDP